MNNVETVKHFQTILGCDKFIVTGSLALAYHGFRVSVKDLDIILVRPTEEANALLKKLKEDNPIPFKPIYPEDNPVSFMFEDQVIDVFIASENEPTELMAEGFYIARIDHIIKAKKRQNRPKDWIQLLQMSSQFSTPAEFGKFVGGYGEVCVGPSDIDSSSVNPVKRKS